jgi:predicted dehydrogenase
VSAPERVWRVALIGISGYGRIQLTLARECRDRGEVAIVAATVINPAEEAANVAELRAQGCAIYADHVEMLRAEAGRIDLCLIPTGIHWHTRMTIAALRAGANVLVEKPLASSQAEIDAIRAAERETGRFVAVGFQDLYEPGTIWLKHELARGAIGKIEAGRFLGVWPRGRGYFQRNDWAGRLQIDGVPVLDSPLHNAFAHFVMLSLYFASARDRGAATAALDRVELFRAHDIPSFDTATVTAHTAEGVKLWFGVSLASAETIEPEIVIHGRDGTAWWRYECEASWCAGKGTVNRRELRDMMETRRAMMAAVLRRLGDPAAPICGVELAAKQTELIEAVHRVGAIQAFPANGVRWVDGERGAATVPEIAGLVPALRQAFAARRTLAESGFALASPAGRR